MTGLFVQHVYKIVDDVYSIVKDINLQAREQDRIVITGPADSGQANILSMIAGLEDVSNGDIYIGEQKINNINPKDRKVALIRANYAMYPEMTVYENLAFGLKLRKYPEEEIRERVQNAAVLLNLEDILMKDIGEISEFQKQMIALGRAVVKEPEVYLLDEPFACLDDSPRQKAMEEVIRLQKMVKKPFVFATRYPEDALTFGTEIIVLKDGEVQQIGTSEELTKKPADAFVADFFGVSAPIHCKIS